jgi:hypothetical protein
MSKSVLYSQTWNLASTYGSNGYGNNLYSQDQATSTTTTPPAKPHSSGLTNTGTNILIITALAAMILITLVFVSRRAKKHRS